METQISPSQTALIVIDMQRYFVHPEYPLGKFVQMGAPELASQYYERLDGIVIPNIQRLLSASRAREVNVVFTEFGSLREDGADLPGWARRHNEVAQETVGSAVYPPFSDPSCRIDESLAPLPGELVVQKTTSGLVNSTKIDQTLRVLGIDTVIVVGVATDVCVAQATRELGDRDFNAFAVSDACATFDPQCHEAALRTIGVTFGTVLDTADALVRLGAA